jgi:hypothetical protein
MTSGFEVTLREQVEVSQQQLAEAVRSDESAEVHRHGARLVELLDRARSHAIDTTGWVDSSLLSTAHAAL